MTRPSKFRVWDKVKKRMGEVLVLSLNDGEVIGAQIDFGDGEAVQLLGDEVELMQFTGLHDKNGEEIYEEDIIQSRHGPLGAVYWNEGIAAFAWRHGMDWGMIEIALDQIEIIGNIHENPELIGD